MKASCGDIQFLADQAQVFCRKWFREEGGNRLLVLQDKPGMGKTMIARAVYTWAQAVAFEKWSRSRTSGGSLPGVSYMEWGDLASVGRLDEKSFLATLSEIATQSLFVLDDIGVEVDQFKTGIPAARLTEILNRRAGKFTLVTTNVPVEMWATHWDARVSDRLLRNSDVIATNVPSYASVKK